MSADPTDSGPGAVSPAGAPVAIVTGASRGIGGHLADGLLEAGYLVEGCSQHGRTSPTPGRAGYEVAVVDVTDEAAVSQFVTVVHRRHGRIDALINAAGVIEPELPLWEADPARWWQVMEVNVRGPFLMSWAVVPLMLAAGGGRVVNVNSGAATDSRADLSAYCGSKSALCRITGGLHLAGYEQGLRAFDLAPGAVATDMTAGMRMHAGRTDWVAPAKIVELVLALLSGRLDAWSGRMVRVVTDTPGSLQRRAEAGLTQDARTLGLIGFGADDPLG